MQTSLAAAFTNHFQSGQGFATIVAARQFAAEILGEPVRPGTALAKQVDEAIEVGVVRSARQLIAQAETTHQAYDLLVDLLQRQPKLGVKSSTSVLQQAYSTPVPIAYFASMLAGITPETTVYEPTAGHGALLLGATPAQVIANEINPDRYGELATRGYRQLTQEDALVYRPAEQVDVVICNPPFGTVVDDNRRTRRFRMYDTWTSQIDQVISLNALQAMKPDGRAVLILGGKLGRDTDQRSERYNSRESRAFYHLLYQHYRVTQHLSLHGDLYRKQGAAFPIDVIVINGTGTAERPLPAADVPTIYSSFDDLKECLPNDPIHHDVSLDLSVYDSALSQLSNAVETPMAAVPVYRAAAPGDSHTGRENLSSADANATGPDDSTIGTGDVAQRDSGDVGQQSGPTGFSSDSAATGGQRPGHLATAVERDPDSQHLAIPGTAKTLRRGLPRDGPDLAQSSRISRLASPARRYSPGGLAGHPDTLIPGPTMDAQLRQVPYLPKSQGTSTQTLIPFNMASAAQVALERFEKHYGNIDDYLAARLGYGSRLELYQYLSAEQIDAAALAISHIEQGAGFITGDQTGIGKGRICASIIRYAQQQGKIAVFVTKDKPLYADMMRDVTDIGMRGFRPFITDSSTEIPLANGGSLKTSSAAQQKQQMGDMMRRGTVHPYSAVFTTYSQLQTVGKKEPLRRQFLRTMMPNAILILDEAHQAGGSQQRWQANGPPDRATLVRELIDNSAGVFYSSATYAKRPDVMDLYARRTDLRLGVSSITALENILTRGGVPLQQIVASKFVASGQMLRRERSYEGITFQAQTVPVDREVADQFSAAMRAIKDFDRAKQKAIKELSKELKAAAKALSEDGAIGDVGAKSTNFTSLMHNCIEQGLLAQKAEATVQAAMQALERGEKPVIAVANTMGSFIQAYADAHDLNDRDPINLSFADLLERYLERSRDVITRDYRGEMTRHRLSDDQLGMNGVMAYEEALETIREGDFSSIPISPIDYIEQQLERAGYQVAEVTGRKAGIHYDADGTTAYKVRPDQESTAKAKIDAVARFNAGDADVILLNCSGSTGISLHASEKFADQRPRHMIVAQAERDINVFMQMLGRVHRTGQVELPRYTLLMGDIPAEKRPGAILCRKMASLNANTTAARETDISLSNVVDFMNLYGEQVVTDLLNDDSELNAKLDFPTAQASGDASEIALVKKVTGRIPLLPVAEQEAVYSLIESEYQDLVEQSRSMGENILEADQLDLDARPLARMEVIADESETQSEFTGPVYLEVVDAKSEMKPLTQIQVINAVRESLGLETVEQVEDHDPEELEAKAEQQVSDTINALTQETETYRATMVQRKREPDAITKFNDRLDNQVLQVTGILQDFTPGATVQILTAGQRLTFYGVVASIEQKHRSGSPAAPNNWKLRIFVADAMRQLTVPLSKVNSHREGALRISLEEKDFFGTDIYELFDTRQTAGRVNRQIFTGNLIRAFEKYPGGKLVNYTDYQGDVRQGLMMAKGFDITEALKKEPVVFKQPHQVKAFLTDLTQREGVVKTLDELLLIKAQRNGNGFVVQAPKSKESGGKYFLDEGLIEAAGSDFYSVSNRMEVVVPSERLESTLMVLMVERGYALAAFEHQEIAREYLGITLPELKTVETEPVPPVSVPPRVVQPKPIQPILKKKAVNPEPVPVNQKSEASKKTMPMGYLEKRVIRFLKEAGIYQAVLESDDFHFKIENEPYIPLVVERHGEELYLTHYLSQNGDTFIDTEMVFVFQEERLEFKETAVQNPLQGGELRATDRSFGQVFSKNILAQGFAEAAKAQWQVQERDNQSPEVVTVVEVGEQQTETTGEVNLFDVEQFSTTAGQPHSEATGPDPTWDVSAKTPKETPSVEKPLTPVKQVINHPISKPSLQEIADEVRNLDLEVIAANLGLEQDRYDKHKWRDGDHIISISQTLFMDWLADKGGGGAIDLVMHVQGVEFRSAVEWLSGQDLSAVPVIAPVRQTEAEADPKQLEMPEPNEHRWAGVKEYLVNRRKLPEALVDRVHEKGLVYADDHQNAVFVRHGLQDGGWQRGEVTGASLRGTWGEHNSYHRLVPGSVRELGWFRIGTGQGPVQRVLLTESPIDAMSLAVLDKERRQQAGVTVYLSTDGTGGVPVEALKAVLQRNGLVVAAFDADKAGEMMAWRVAAQVPGVRRLQPAYGKDWNERLVNHGQPEQVQQTELDRGQLQPLWQWHQTAWKLGRSEKYLTRIAEVATDVLKGRALSEKAQVAMHKDLAMGQKQAKRQAGNQTAQML
ncbi:strawberry notch C-terminal domain-containing protein [Adonisia turfae]|uniref:DUF3991 domain-containing protein n=1 Tax=Adonisia turfae CCMR0081 TaxID=2292702 RepID=A0A6M0RGJ4_9CYAN|nr:strawberry notch C-terminal domain-containing protein [Adonisia turfae]NEZ55407.1 DUF3991 domain-containing protein [Adonisia turfae CCMR0081]